MRGLARIYDVRMAQFVLKIEKLSHIMGPRASQDLRSPSPIMAPDNIGIQMVSSPGAGGQHVFSPSASNLTATVYLGNFAKNQGEHYVSLEQVVVDHDNDNGEEAMEECHLDDVTGDCATENEGNTKNEDDVGDSGDMVAEVALGGQKEQLRQNSDGSDMREGEKEHITLQLVPDEDVGVLNLASRINSNYDIENLPNEVLDQMFKIVLMSSAIVFAGNACHAYQKLCGVNKRFRAVTRNLSSMLPRVYIRGGVQFRILSVRSLIKRYGTSSGLVMELRRIISSSKWANAWFDVQEGEYDWYFIKKIFLEKK